MKNGRRRRATCSYSFRTCPSTRCCRQEPPTINRKWQNNAAKCSLPPWAGESEIDLANQLIILFADGEIMMIDAHSRPPADV